MIMPGQLTKVAFHTLGCKLNFAETSSIARSLPEERFRRVAFSEEADIYVINSCSVTDAADRKCRQTISRIVHRHPDALIAVVGCYSQLDPHRVASIPGVDLVLGSAEKFDIVRYLDNIRKRKAPEIHSCETESLTCFMPSWSMGDRTRSFLKVQDGCDYHCSYCTIPLARGISRNPAIAECIREAREIAATGVKEIVLTGVNTGDFGKSTGESLAGLLKALSEVKDIERYRISSIEPNLLTDEIIDMVSSGGPLLPHFHIPLQSGCNRTLAAMRRRYTRELFADRVEKIRQQVPMAGIGADVITGFPGESDEDFADTVSFLESMSLSYLHVFRYSERPGTDAECLPGKVPHKTREVRSKLLMRLSESKKMVFLNLNIGRTMKVLFEGPERNGIVSGFTPNYIRVNADAGPGSTGIILNVKLIHPTEETEAWGVVE